LKPLIKNSVYSMDLHEFKLFRSLVHERTGIWLRDGKHVMLASRLSRRLRHHGLTSFAEYYELVRKMTIDEEEIRQLINCVTTNKTSFFRERHHFQFLSQTVAPQVQSAVARGAAQGIRVWSAACSTGEEPYSISITLLEALQRAQGGRTMVRSKSAASAAWTIEVVASDIDTAVLDTARRAVYRDESLETVDIPLQSRYFLRGKDDMQGFVKVKPDVSRLVQFMNINLMDARWPLDGLFDVIFFRNALIYFTHETQDVFLRKMAHYLKPNGYLFLGNSEHIPWLREIFTPLTQTMYQLRSRE
jgi:chemotaxis protein methyltransferase CheR